MQTLLTHLPVLPVLLPVLTGGVLMLVSERHRVLREVLSLSSSTLQLAVAVLLVLCADGQLGAPFPQGFSAYELGAWAAPFGITLVVDRLAASMTLLATLLGLTALCYSLARWEKVGVHFLSMFQFLVMGVCGSFLTGDLFNLFVFFEVMLAASYGLMLHGSGLHRVRAGVHYVVVNLIGAQLFLVAAAIIYGVTGTLNMADLALRVPLLSAEDRALLDIGAVLLGLVFLIKAGAWPLNFWLGPAYGSATPPVGAVFAILTKVGVYALLRFEMLLHESTTLPMIGGDWMFNIGLLTIAIGTFGLLAAQRLERAAALLVVISSGTLLTALAFGGGGMTAPALLYLFSSVLASGAFFMVIDMTERTHNVTADLLAVSFEAFGMADKDEDSDYPEDTSGVAIPAAMAFLGLAFVSSALLLTGLPPLSSFIAKLGLLDLAIDAAPVLGWASWAFIAALLLSGLAGLIALSRLGIRAFWDSEVTTPRLALIEALPVTLLIAATLLLAVFAGPALEFFHRVTVELGTAQHYIDAGLPALREATP